MNYPAHLSFDELERYAFLTGDGLTASLAETAHDLEQDNSRHVTDEKRVRAEAYESGKLDGLGQDVQTTITNLTQQALSLQAQLTKATALFGTCHAWLVGDQAKTVRGRREAAHSLANQMASQGLGYPRH